MQTGNLPGREFLRVTETCTLWARMEDGHTSATMEGDGDLHAVGPAMEDGHTSATMEGDGDLHAVGLAMEDGHTSATMEGDGDLHAVGPAMEDGHTSATMEGDGDLQTVGPAMEDGHTSATMEGDGDLQTVGLAMEDGHTPAVTEACLIHEERIKELERKLQNSERLARKLQKDKENLLRDPRMLLADDQVECIRRDGMRGGKWSDATVQMAMKLRCACGNKGYMCINENVVPLPSVRTLQRKIEHVKFKPGILTELFPSLKAKVSTMLPEERNAALMIDEMQITAGTDYDPSVKGLIGKLSTKLGPKATCTDGRATHAMVFMLGGMSSRWKQTVAYHLTGTSFCKLEMRNFIFTLIKECEFIGIRIDAIITDMGPGNQAIWSICGIGATKHGKTSVSCAHPCANGSDRQLFFIADAPHVLKNLRGHLVRGQLISIPDEIVERNKLPTSEVSLSYVRDVAQRDGTSALKLAPHLKDKHLDPNHYEKMSVSSALAVLNHSTGSAIRVLVKEGKMSPAAVTTAWFLETVYKWFRLMTSRTKSLAMSELNSRKHDDAVEFLSEVLDLFKKMTIHLPGKSPSWKPVQTGVVISTTAALSLQNLYLTQYNFKYLFLSRLTQDALENLFSVIRQKNATPRPLQFKTALRTITLSQFFQPCRTGNYEMDDAEYLADFISKRQAESPSEEVLQQDGASAIQDESAWELPDDDDQMLAQVVDVLSDSQAAMGELQSTDKQSLHYLCGYTVKAVCGKYKLCETCSQREESGSAPLPGVAASTRRRATCSVNNGSDGRSPILNAKAKPRRVDKKGRRRKDVTFAKAYRNNREGLVRGFSVFTTPWAYN
ncbi:uncharacterized protein ISCGN_004303 [Ixodes scapularis]